MTDHILQGGFAKWANRVLKAADKARIGAYAFLLYEHFDSFAIQLVGASRYREKNPFTLDDQVFSSKEDLFEIPHTVSGDHWENGLAVAKILVNAFVDRSDIRTSTIVIGFVDGDLEVLGS